jgi:hypothetical protein
LIIFRLQLNGGPYIPIIPAGTHLVQSGERTLRQVQIKVR